MEEDDVLRLVVKEARECGTVVVAPGLWLVHGKVVKFGDHIDTDAIIPGDACHLATPNELGPHCFKYVRPEFRGLVQGGSRIVLAGVGWGTGSSREHAVWALAGAGVHLVLAKSIAYIHRRNLVNEARPLHAVIDDGCYEAVQEGDELLVEIDLTDEPRVNILHLATNRSFAGQPPPSAAAVIMTRGGLVASIRR